MRRTALRGKSCPPIFLSPILPFGVSNPLPINILFVCDSLAPEQGSSSVCGPLARGNLPSEVVTPAWDVDVQWLIVSGTPPDLAGIRSTVAAIFLLPHYGKQGIPEPCLFCMPCVLPSPWIFSFHQANSAFPSLLYLNIISLFHWSIVQNPLQFHS